jgi:hypothetical protein
MNKSEFNDVTGLGRYRHPNKKRDALDSVKDGIKGRAEKDYRPENIAEVIRALEDADPILKTIKGRDIRQFCKESGIYGETATKPKAGSKSKGGTNS